MRIGLLKKSERFANFFLRLSCDIVCPKYPFNSLDYFFNGRLPLFLEIPIPQPVYFLLAYYVRR